MEYVIGIDIGTGSVKAVAVNLSGESFQVSQQHYPSNSPKPGYHEQDPAQIWTAFAASLQELLLHIGIQPQAISLSSAMHSLIAVDEQGDALAPMMTWADNRSADVAKRLLDTGEGMAIYRATGTPVHAMSPFCKLIWLKENNPALCKNAHKFISIKEYIWYQLFKVFEIDYSIASCTGLFNLEELNWHQPAIRLSGLNADQLSTPVNTHYSRTFEGHPALPALPAGIPVVIGASDGCLANLGSMAYKPGLGVMTIGTSGAIRRASSKPLPDESSMPFSYILEEGTFICGGPINNGGIALQWWMKNDGRENIGPHDYEAFFAQVEKIPAGSEGLVFLPYLTGERAPVWDSGSCGVFFGVRLLHKQAHFARAVVEGICYAMRNVLETVDSEHAPIEQVHISGGFLKSSVWVQLLADITGKKLVLVQKEDASAIGATYLAMKSLGMISSYPELSSEKQKVIYPNTQKSLVHSNNFSIFKKLYFDLKHTMHHFNQ